MKLKNLLTAALVLTATTTGLSASETTYMGGFGGLNLFKNDDKVVSTQVNKDYTGGFTIGQRFDNGIKVEGEAAYHKNRQSINEISDNRTLALMANLLYELPLETGLRPHVGVGAGWANQKRSLTTSTTTSSTVIDDDGASFVQTSTSSTTNTSIDQKFAWQALAGVNMPINESWELTADYRYFRPTGSEDDRNHAVVLGVQHLF